MKLRRPGKAMTREQAMAARPRQLPTVSRQRQEGGKLVVRVELERPSWQRWLGAPGRFGRTFVLDTYGQEVYESCDGKTKVERIIRDFAAEHKVSQAEAELAVSKFLQTLVAKGLVAIEVKKSS